MAHPRTEEIINQIHKLLDDHGVRDYVFGFGDPDSPNDIVRVNGSIFWRMGFTTDLLECCKFDRRTEWQLGNESWDGEEYPVPE